MADLELHEELVLRERLRGGLPLSWGITEPPIAPPCQMRQVTGSLRPRTPLPTVPPQGLALEGRTKRQRKGGPSKTRSDDGRPRKLSTCRSRIRSKTGAPEDSYTLTNAGICLIQAAKTLPGAVSKLIFVLQCYCNQNELQRNLAALRDTKPTSQTTVLTSWRHSPTSDVTRRDRKGPSGKRVGSYRSPYHRRKTPP